MTDDKPRYFIPAPPGYWMLELCGEPAKDNYEATREPIVAWEMVDDGVSGDAHVHCAYPVTTFGEVTHRAHSPIWVLTDVCASLARRLTTARSSGPMSNGERRRRGGYEPRRSARRVLGCGRAPERRRQGSRIYSQQCRGANLPSEEEGRRSLPHAASRTSASRRTHLKASGCSPSPKAKTSRRSGVAELASKLRKRQAAPTAAVRPLPLTSLRAGQCHWPINSPERGGVFLFCSAPAAGNYCAKHAALARSNASSSSPAPRARSPVGRAP